MNRNVSFASKTVLLKAPVLVFENPKLNLKAPPPSASFQGNAAGPSPWPLQPCELKLEAPTLQQRPYGLMELIRKPSRIAIQNTSLHKTERRQTAGLDPTLQSQKSPYLRHCRIRPAAWLRDSSLGFSHEDKTKRAFNCRARGARGWRDLAREAH